MVTSHPQQIPPEAPPIVDISDDSIKLRSRKRRHTSSMATATSSLFVFERPDWVGCPVCLLGKAVLKQLECGHSVCEECVRGLRDYYDLLPATSSQSYYIKCPKCRRTTYARPEELPTNYAYRGSLTPTTAMLCSLVF